MRVKIVLAASLLMISVSTVAVRAALAAPPKSPARSTRSSQSPPAVAGRKIVVLNPAATNAMVARSPLAPRLNSLEGKTIYMVDIGWGGPEAGYDVLQIIAKWFAQYVPTAKTVVLRKKGSYAADDPDLWKEIKAKAQAAILGLSC